MNLLSAPVTVLVTQVAIILAGAGWICLAGLWDRTNLLERIVLSYLNGLIVVIASLSLAIYLGFQVSFIFLVALAVSIAFASPQFLRAFGRPIQLGGVRRHWVFLLILLLQSVFWFAYFYAFPHFPTSEPIDIVWHSDLTARILAGNLRTPIAANGAPVGAHAVFAFVAFVSNVSVLDSVRVTTAFIATLTLAAIYCLFLRSLVVMREASIGLLVFSMVFSPEMIYYNEMGAFPNIVGDFFVVSSLFLIFLSLKASSARIIVSTILAEVVALTVHLSVLIFGAAALIYGLVLATSRKSHSTDFLKASAGFAVAPISAFVVLPFGWATAKFAAENYVDFGTNPALLLMQAAYNAVRFVGPLNAGLLIVSALLVLADWRSETLKAFFLLWFGVLTSLIFFTTNDWRLVLLSLTPGSALVAHTLYQVHSTLLKSLKRSFSIERAERLSILVMSVLFLVLIATGPLPETVSYVTNREARDIQREIFDSMMWLKANSLPTDAILSVGLRQEYRYLTASTGLAFVGDLEGDVDELLAAQPRLGFSVVVVSLGVINVIEFEHNARLVEVYRNARVAIFRVV